jgi:2-polyprenyl-3-methyl-5-hydroxy-6-metoxy-1,4-benzoquinol methylase
MFEQVGCNLCGEQRATLFQSTPIRPSDPSRRYCFVRCNSCGLIYLNPIPTWEERAKLYCPTYPGYNRLASTSSLLQRYSMKYGLHKRFRLIRTEIPNGKLLDVGCGGGDFLNWVRQRSGWNVFGLERAHEIAQFAQNQYKLPIVLADQMHASFAPNLFDVITLWTVLEHLQNPTQGLLESARLIRQGGLLVIRTVTVDSWAARLFGSYWLGYDAPRILFVFSKHTLKQLLEKTGFELIHIGENFHDFHPYLWSWHNFCEDYLISNRVRQIVNLVSGSWIMRFLSFPYFAIQTLLGGNSFVTAIARKS